MGSAQLRLSTVAQVGGPKALPGLELAGSLPNNGRVFLQVSRELEAAHQVHGAGSGQGELEAHQVHGVKWIGSWMG